MLGKNEAKKEQFTCDGHLEREIQGINRGDVSHAALSGRD